MTKRLILVMAVCALALGCDDNGDTDAGPGGSDAGPPVETDAGPGDMDAGPGDDDAGPGDDDAGPGDAGPGDDPFVFATDDPASYTRIDRAGAPAVSTAVISSGEKNNYNDGDPADDITGDAPGRWAGEIIANLGALHATVGMTSGLTLDQQLMGLGFVPCAGGVACATQTVGGPTGPAVHSFVIPDVITVNIGAAAGFPNGRQLSDPVMDVMLSLLLLDLTAMTTGDPPVMQGPGSLGAVPLNPTENDLAFRTEFPYVAAPHTP